MVLLVTGGAGFIGANFIRSVLERPKVARLINLDCLTYAGSLANLRGVDRHAKYAFEKVNLGDRDAVQNIVRVHGITHVVHLAAETHVDRSIAGPGDFVQTNVVGTYHLLEACRQAWAAGSTPSPAEPRFVHVSTDEVYGSLESGAAPFTESSPLQPNSPYAASKAAADHLMRSYHQTYGFPAVITRSSNNYGPRQHEEKLIPTIIRCLRERQPIPLYGDGLNIRDWLHVDDHGEALWQALAKGIPGETYNIGGNNERANIEIAHRLCDHYDEHSHAARGTSRLLIQHVRDRLGHDRRYAIHCGKIERELGWKPQRAFDASLRETLEWYLDAGMENPGNP